MIGVSTVAEAWELMRARLWLWLLIGIFAAILEACLLVPFFISRVRSDALILLYIFGALSSVLAFLIAGGLIRTGLHFSRSGDFMLTRLLLPARTAIDLAQLAIAATLSRYALDWVLENFVSQDITLRSWVPILIGVPFVLAIPLLVDQGLRPDVATRESIRLAGPKYFRVLFVQVYVFVIASLSMLPFFCLLPIAMRNVNPTQLPFLIALFIGFSFELPLYYLTVCRIYEKLVPSPSHE